MKFVPHDYQKYAIEFIKEHNIAAILLDCGLGKTSITLTAIQDLLFDSFEVHKVLVIAPHRVAKVSWPDELSKWEHLSNLTFSVCVGTARQRIEALKAKADIYIINRENINWLIDRDGFDFDMVVVDELSSFKNHQAKRFKSFMKVRTKVKRIVGLTGSPSSNGLMDLFAEYKMLDMGERLGRFIGNYRNAYFKPDKMNGQIVYSYKLLPGAEETIYDKISDITISMRATEHLKMPELVLNNVMAEMDDKEKQSYERMKKDLVLSLSDGEVTAANAASLSMKLCQMANGAIYNDNGKAISFHDRKLDALEDIIEATNGKNILVAYWFRHDFERIKERLDKLKVQWQKVDSDASIRDWNEGKVQIGLINPGSAGCGLNLQNGGSTLVWFSLTWSLELYQQCNARLWRQGQQSTVVIHHIVTKGTIDEQIVKALATKDKTQTALIDAVKANIPEVMKV